jgi:hypothetical protein
MNLHMLSQFYKSCNNRLMAVMWVAVEAQEWVVGLASAAQLVSVWQKELARALASAALSGLVLAVLSRQSQKNYCAWCWLIQQLNRLPRQISHLAVGHCTNHHFWFGQ